jgi:hypothetical protein
MSTMASPSPDQLQRLWASVVAWRDEYDVTCPEALLQVDSVNKSLPELAEVLLDVVGYRDHERRTMKSSSQYNEEEEDALIQEELVKASAPTRNAINLAREKVEPHLITVFSNLQTIPKILEHLDVHPDNLAHVLANVKRAIECLGQVQLELKQLEGVVSPEKVDQPG